MGRWRASVGPWLVAAGLLTPAGTEWSWRQAAISALLLPVLVLIRQNQPELAMVLMLFATVNGVASFFLLPGWAHHLIIMFDCVCIMWVYLDCRQA